MCVYMCVYMYVYIYVCIYVTACGTVAAFLYRIQCAFTAKMMHSPVGTVFATAGKTATMTH